MARTDRRRVVRPLRATISGMSKTSIIIRNIIRGVIAIAMVSALLPFARFVADWSPAFGGIGRGIGALLVMAVIAIVGVLVTRIIMNTVTGR